MNLVSASPLPLEGFSLNIGQMFASVRWCVEPITQLCWLKVKVTIEGHQFEPWILRLLHCHSDCLVKFGSNVRLSEMMCRTDNSTMQTQGQGHNWRSSVSFSFASFERFSWNFSQMFALVRQCAEPITQACRLKVKVIVKGHEFEPWISCSLHIFWTLWKIFIKFGSNVRLSEMMCRTHNSRSRSQFKATSLSLEFWGRSIVILRQGDIAVLRTALLFLRENKTWYCESSALQMIHKKYQALFSLKSKTKNVWECCLQLLWLVPYSFPTSGDFCHLLITFANSLDPHQAWQNVKKVWKS